MKKYQLLSVTSPLVEIECGGTVVRTQPIKDASKDPNFPDPIISFDVVRQFCTFLIVKQDSKNLAFYNLMSCCHLVFA